MGLRQGQTNSGSFKKGNLIGKETRFKSEPNLEHSERMKGHIGKFAKCHNTGRTWFKKGHLQLNTGRTKFKMGHPKFGGKDFQKGQKGYWLGKQRTENNKKKMSLVAKRRFANPKNHPNFGKSSPHGKGSYYKGIWMRSSWEINIAKWLDEQNIEWRYEPKRFILKDRTYCPDFYLIQQNIYWEVKGWFHKRHQETIRQFREMYSQENLLVLTKPIYETIINNK